MTELRLILFGGFEALLPSGLHVNFAAKKAQALLAYCALRPGTHLRQTLATLFWGETPDHRARNSLRQTLFVLRTGLTASMPRILRVEADTIATNALALDVDVRAFERLAAQGTPPALEVAAALYRGDLLDGLVVEAEPFEQWLILERERLRDLAIEVLAKLFRHQCVTGVPEAAIQTARRLLVLDPLQEVVHRALMRLLAQGGRREAALHQYEVCAGLLRRELRLEPETDTGRLRDDIVNGHALRPTRSPWSIEEVATDGGTGPPASVPLVSAEQSVSRKALARAGDWTEYHAQIVEAQRERERARRLRAEIIENRALLRDALKKNADGVMGFKRLILERPRDGSTRDRGNGGSFDARPHAGEAATGDG